MQKRKGEGTTFTLDRKLFSSDIWNGNPHKLKLWIYLIGSANWYDSKWQNVKIPRGCAIRSERTISEDCRIPKTTVRRYMRELQNEGRIKVTSLDRLGSFIEIKKYNNLQQDAKAILTGMDQSNSIYNNYTNTKLYLLEKARSILDQSGDLEMLKFAQEHALTQNEIDQVRGT